MLKREREIESVCVSVWVCVSIYMYIKESLYPIKTYWKADWSWVCSTISHLYHPLVCELVGKKWSVEHQQNNTDIIINAEPKHTVYIFNCVASTIQVKERLLFRSFMSPLHLFRLPLIVSHFLSHQPFRYSFFPLFFLIFVYPFYSPFHFYSFFKVKGKVSSIVCDKCTKTAGNTQEDFKRGKEKREKMIDKIKGGNGGMK